jgi:hypothetical protein
MLMFASTPSASLSPTPQQIADLRLAATQMTGATRRAFSNSRSILKIPYELCRKGLSAPFRAPFVVFGTTRTANTKARRETPQLLVSTWVEFRRGHGTR